MRNSFAMPGDSADKYRRHGGSLRPKDVRIADASRPCDTHPDLVAFKYPLPHLTQSLKRQRRTRIVAIGSSSTAGADGIPASPCRLEMMLRDRFYGRVVGV